MTQHDAGTPPTRRVRMVQVTWSYSPAHNLRRANAIAVAVAGRLNEHVYVLAPCRYGHGETIDLFFAAHADCTCSDEALQDLIQRVIAPLAEHSCFDVLPPRWSEVRDGVAYYDGRVYLAWSDGGVGCYETRGADVTPATAAVGGGGVAWRRPSGRARRRGMEVLMLIKPNLKGYVHYPADPFDMTCQPEKIYKTKS